MRSPGEHLPVILEAYRIKFSRPREQKIMIVNEKLPVVETTDFVNKL